MPRPAQQPQPNDRGETNGVSCKVCALPRRTERGDFAAHGGDEFGRVNEFLATMVSNDLLICDCCADFPRWKYRRAV